LNDEFSSLNIILPKDLIEILRKDAEMNICSEANRVVWVLREYYRAKEREAELFSRNQLREGRKGHVPVFRSEDQFPPPAASKFRESGGPSDNE